ncbi:hypothetical protein CHS0354_013852, partial [Potamilus streckersoni]
MERRKKIIKNLTEISEQRISTEEEEMVNEKEKTTNEYDRRKQINHRTSKSR